VSNLGEERRALRGGFRVAAGGGGHGGSQPPPLALRRGELGVKRFEGGRLRPRVLHLRARHREPLGHQPQQRDPAVDSALRCGAHQVRLRLVAVPPVAEGRGARDHHCVDRYLWAGVLDLGQQLLDERRRLAKLGQPLIELAHHATGLAGEVPGQRAGLLRRLAARPRAGPP